MPSLVAINSPLTPALHAINALFLLVLSSTSHKFQARTSPPPHLGRVSFGWGSLAAFPSASLSASLNGIRATINRGRHPLLPSATDSRDGSTTIATETTTTEPAIARKLMRKTSFMSRSYDKLCKLHNKKVASETTPITTDNAKPDSPEQVAIYFTRCIVLNRLCPGLLSMVLVWQ